MQNEHKMPKLYIYYAYIVDAILVSVCEKQFNMRHYFKDTTSHIYQNSAYRNLIIVIICVRNHYKCISLSRVFWGLCI